MTRAVHPQERGSGTVLMLALVGILIAATGTVLALATALVARQRADASADLSALAGARALLRGEDACAAAGRVAAAGRARLVVCRPAGTAVLVVVEVPAPDALRGLDMPPARARARAGVPP